MGFEDTELQDFPDDGPTCAQSYKWSALWRTNTFAMKEYEASKESHGNHLKRSLQWWDLMGYGLASTLGAGIFVVAGQVANMYAGPAIVFSFLVAAFSCVLSAFCYSEFAARIPLSGSAYTFSYITLGELMGWFIGWNLTLEYAISASAVARSWTNYVANLWDNVFPDHKMYVWIYGYPLWGGDLISLSPISAMIILLCTFILCFGVKSSTTINLIFTVLNILIILFIIICGAIYIDVAYYSPFFPYGAGGVFQGAGVVFFSYIGFDSVTTLAGEVKNPTRDLPLGIIGTLGLVTLLYVAVSFVITGMVPYYDIDLQAPLSAAFQAVGLNWAANLVAVGSITTLSSTTFASLVGQPRIFYQMAKDGLFFSVFGQVTASGTPLVGTVVSGVFSATVAFFLSQTTLTDMISIGTLMAFAVVCGGILILRYQDATRPWAVPGTTALFFVAAGLSCLSIIYGWPYWAMGVYTLATVLLGATFVLFPVMDVPVTFRAPLVPLLPLLGVWVNLFLILSLDVWSILRVVLWTVLGFAIYFLYGIWNSREGRHRWRSGPTAYGPGPVSVVVAPSVNSTPLLSGSFDTPLAPKKFDEVEDEAAFAHAFE